MPKVSEIFRRKYVRLEDLQGKVHRLTIERVIQEQIDGEKLWIAYFEGKQKGLVLRLMISEEIAAFLGDEMDGWKGQELELYRGTVQLRNGDVNDAFRARRPLPEGAHADDPTGF